MAFAIAVTNLIEAMRESGCPICALERKAARQTADGFLYENMMNPGERERALNACGFCPPHTRLLAAVELGNTGEPIGISILYETLNRRTSAALRGWQRGSRFASQVRRLLRAAGLTATAPTALPQIGSCPICERRDQAGQNAAAALFSELERKSADVLAAYQSSDGLCLRHLRAGLTSFGDDYPQAARWLAQFTAEQLETQAAQMSELVRKKNWEYRSEKLTPEEALAWRRALTFYTGYPQDSFHFNIEDL